ncbi:MAG: HNH endonuclease [Candidatus Berkelbacteria bacterium]|nr:HNH endonuclease [Candidatus Berkelbacteria bacterium]
MENKLTKSTLKTKYVQTNKSVLQVAKELGVSHKVVRRYLKKYGFKIRSISEVMTGRKLSPAHREKVIKTLSSYGDQTGEKNHRWKGGRTTSGGGYIWIKKLDHPNKNAQGYVPEHRLIIEKEIGRYLLPDEHIHHINENKQDNRLENLRIVSPQEHAAIHWKNPEARKKVSDRVKKIYLDPREREKQSERMKVVRSKKYWSTKKVSRNK